MLSPWTQSVTLKWRPELRFYETRFEILRELEEQGVMWSFRAGENLAEARLVDQSHQLSVRQDRASMHLLNPDAQAEVVWEAFKVALLKIKPRTLVSAAVSLQYVAELATDFETAVTRGRDRMFGFLSGGVVRSGDWAVLMDLNVEEPVAANGQTEFGVVRDAEVPARLGRNTGRANLGDSPAVDRELWTTEVFPPVSVFADVTFEATAAAFMKGTKNPVDSLWEFWDTTRSQAGRVVEELKMMIVADDTNEEVAS